MMKRTRFVAQVIGFACIGLLAFYGTAVAVSGRPAPWRAPSAATTAITPGYVSYQGTLRDAADEPATGTYDMEVKICRNAACSSAALWCEQHNAVTVRDGQFNLLLGDGDGACAGSPAPPNGPIERDIFTQPDRWVELTVEGTVMTPRQRLAAVPYAMSASYATTLSAPDGRPAEAATVDNAGNVTIEEGDLEVVQGGVCVDSDGICSPPGGGGLRANGDVYLATDASAAVGIGQTTPETELDVAGDASVSGKVGVGTTSPGAEVSAVGVVRAANEVGELNYTEIGHGGGNGYINTVGDGDLKFRHDGSNKMSLSDAGDLNVSGNVSWAGHLQTMDVSSEDHLDPPGSYAGWNERTLVPSNNSICFLVGMAVNNVDTESEWIKCEIVKDAGDWVLRAYATDADEDGWCKARCVSW